ncbi:MAG: glycosyltransferase family 4 protein, partial [Flavobacteriales bacterium]
MKLAILTDGIYPYVIGGMQKHSFYLTKFLVELGVDVTLYHCVTKGDPPTEKQVKEDLEIPYDAQFRSVCIPFPHGNGMPGHYVRANYVYSINQSKDILEQKFDFIYAKGFAAWHLLELKRKNKAKLPPIGVKFHGYEMFQDAPNFKTKLQHFLLRGPVKFNNQHADFVFSYGGKITPIVESLGVKNDRIIEIPTGIAESWLRDPKELKDSQKRLLFIGRYERRKGIEELNKALTDVMDETSFEVDFIGPIPGSKMLKHPRIKYHGTIMDQNELKKLMDQCAVLLCPSHSEGMPNVIMEGMARGLAVLATDVGA